MPRVAEADLPLKPDAAEAAEFWHSELAAPLRPVQRNAGDSEATTVPWQHCECTRCGSSLDLAAGFCPACGHQVTKGEPGTAWNRLLGGFGLTSGSLFCLIAGIACLGAALATGFMYRPQTLAEWQAVQVWRVEWLLGAIAMFCCGLLLKRCKQVL